MDAILYFDTEDTVSPPHAGTDDIILWLADVLTEHGLRGCFHIIGDKARLLESRGRTDVIQALHRHDVSSHFDRGSIHPMTVEQVAASDWHQGVSITLDNEQKGFDEIQRIMGRCSALTRHGSSYAPQIVRAAGLCGKMYHGVPFALPDHLTFWFCGTLCTSQIGLIRSSADKPAIGKFEEDTFADDQAFNEQLQSFIPVLSDCAARWDFAAMFGCHPLRLVLTRFCNNYVAGHNAHPLVPAPVRAREDLKRVKRNFIRYIHAISQIPNLHILGMDEIAARYHQRPSTIKLCHIRTYVNRVILANDVPLDEFFSPAELLVAMAQCVIAHDRHELLPEQVDRLNVIGPATLLPRSNTGESISVVTLLDAAHYLVRFAVDQGELPAAIPHGRMSLSPADILGLLAKRFEDLVQAASQSAYTVKPRNPWPAIGDDVESDVRQMAKWRILSPTTDFTSIARYTQYQTWSLAPAYAM